MYKVKFAQALQYRLEFRNHLIVIYMKRGAQYDSVRM